MDRLGPGVDRHRFSGPLGHDPYAVIMVVDSMTLWGIGIVTIIILALVAHRLVARATDRRWYPWGAVVGVIVAGVGTLIIVDTSLDVPRAVATLDRQVGLPATYAVDDGTGGGVDPEVSSLTLNRDGSATLRNVVLANDVTQNETGRWCLSGEPVATSGDAHWSMSGNGAVRIDANGKVGQLFPDPKLILGYGWARGYLLTSCDVPLATVYWATTTR